MYGHEEEKEEIRNIENMEDDSMEHDSEVNDDYCCCYCNEILETQAELIDHMGNAHIDRFPHINQEPNISSS